MAEFAVGDYSKYPFLPGFQEYVKSFGLSLEEEAAKPVLDRARRRVVSAARGRMSPTARDAEIEALSFLVAAVVVRACNSPQMVNAFSRVEGRRSRDAFRREEPLLMSRIANAIFDLNVGVIERGREPFDRYEFKLPVHRYLKTLSPLNLFDKERWKLVNNPVSGGFVYINRNALVDLFGAQCSSLVRMKVMEISMPEKLPRGIEAIVEEAKSVIPPPRPPPPQQLKYTYVEKLLESPVDDGRHRLVWLVLAPYLVNIKKLEEWEAQATIVNYLDKCGWRGSPIERFVRYHVLRAKKIGLLPPRLETLAKSDSQLYRLILEATAKQVKDK